jgi:hypothetical protein
MKNSEINMMEMMKECMKGCRWCAFMPITFGAILFLLGYYLDAEIVRILWLIFTGFIVLMGIFMFIMVSALFR